jgi:hypothetical protein
MCWMGVSHIWGLRISSYQLYGVVFHERCFPSHIPWSSMRPWWVPDLWWTNKCCNTISAWRVALHYFEAHLKCLCAKLNTFYMKLNACFSQSTQSDVMWNKLGHIPGKYLLAVLLLHLRPTM